MAVDAGEGRFAPGVRAFLWGSALMGAAWAIPWSLLALFLDRRGFSKEEIGLVVSCDAWGKVLIALPAAFVLARRPTRPVLLAATCAAGVAYALLPWMPNLHALMACTLLAGLAWSVHFVAIAPFLYRHARVGERARLFGWSEAVHTGAAVAGAWGSGRLVTLLTAQLGNEREALAWALAAAGLLAFSSAWPYARIVEAPVEPGERAARPVTVFWRERARLARFALPQLCIALGAGLVIAFLGLYFQDRFGLAPSAVADLNAVGWLLMTLGYLLTPRLQARFGFVGSIVVLELASIPFFLVLAFTHSLPFAVAGFLARGVLMNAATPVLKNFSIHATPRDARALQNGVTSLASGVGWAISPRLGGWLLDHTGNDYARLICITVGLYVIAAFATWALLRRLEPDVGRGAVDGRASA
ncbi:MAG: MFS transporter [Planctomycetes bacterium]|nr:MFS transporter [Planctomycetota bacterium]